MRFVKVVERCRKGLVDMQTRVDLGKNVIGGQGADGFGYLDITVDTVDMSRCGWPPSNLHGAGGGLAHDLHDTHDTYDV